MAEAPRRSTRQRKAPALLINEGKQRKRKTSDEDTSAAELSEPDAADLSASDAEASRGTGRRKGARGRAQPRGRAARGPAFFRAAQAWQTGSPSGQSQQQAHAAVRFEGRAAAVRAPTTGTALPALFPASQRIKCAHARPHAMHLFSCLMHVARGLLIFLCHFPVRGCSLALFHERAKALLQDLEREAFPEGRLVSILSLTGCTARPLQLTLDDRSLTGTVLSQAEDDAVDISTGVLQLPRAVPGLLQLPAELPLTRQPGLQLQQQQERVTGQHQRESAASGAEEPAASVAQRNGRLQEHAAADTPAPDASSAQDAAAARPAHQQALADAKAFEEALVAASKVRHCHGGLFPCLGRAHAAWFLPVS